MKKEACHRVQQVKISRNWSLGFVGCLCAGLKNQTIGRQWQCAQPALMLVTWDTGVSVIEWAIIVMINLANTGKNCTWHGDRVERGESCKPTEPASGEMIFPGPPFPPKVSPNGSRAIFAPLPQKMQILFHSGNKKQFKLCSQSVSNYQNKLVEAEKLFKKVTFLPDSTVMKTGAFATVFFNDIQQRNEQIEHGNSTHHSWWKIHTNTISPVNLH